jgi:AcrR family transcriptional regulator
MTPPCFVDMLGQYLAKVREIARQLLEAQQLAQPTEAIEASLLNHLTAYMWTVCNQALLLLAAADSITDEQQAEQLLTRLSVVEALVELRRGKLPQLPADPTTDLNSLHVLLQRLVAAESSLFHLFRVAPLN